MGKIAWSPPVSDALNTRVIRTFGDGFGQARVSGLMQVAAPGDAQGGQNYAAIILGKNLQMSRRKNGTDTRDIQSPNAYEHRARAANYQTWIQLSREDALFDQIGKVIGIAELAGQKAAEHPTAMIEATIQLGFEYVDHTGTVFYSGSKPVKPGSTSTWANTDELGALDFDSYDEAVRQFSQIPEEDGRASNNKASFLATCSDYKEIGREILKNTRPKEYAGGDNLRASDGADLVVVPDWPTGMWGLFDCTTQRDRAVHYIEALPFTVSPIETDPNGSYAKKFGRLEWLVDGYAAACYGNPRKSFMVYPQASVAAMLTAIKAKIDMNDFDFTLT